MSTSLLYFNDLKGQSCFVKSMRLEGMDLTEKSCKKYRRSGLELKINKVGELSLGLSIAQEITYFIRFLWGLSTFIHVRH